MCAALGGLGQRGTAVQCVANVNEYVRSRLLSSDYLLITIKCKCDLIVEHCLHVSNRESDEADSKRLFRLDLYTFGALIHSNQIAHTYIYIYS